MATGCPRCWARRCRGSRRSGATSQTRFYAGRLESGQTAANLDLSRAFNVDFMAGTLNLARQAAAVGVRRFVFISSVKVNGESGSVLFDSQVDAKYDALKCGVAYVEPGTDEFKRVADRAERACRTAASRSAPLFRIC